MKDPILQSYTYEELLYEYFDTIEREKAILTSSEEEIDHEEAEKFEENLAWVEEEERKEREAAKAKKAAEEIKKNEDWIEEQIEKEKERLGDDSLGEDLSFSE